MKLFTLIMNLPCPTSFCPLLKAKLLGVNHEFDDGIGFGIDPNGKRFRG